MLTKEEEKLLINDYKFDNHIKSRGSHYYYGNNIPAYRKTIRGGSYKYNNNNLDVLTKNGDGTYYAFVFGSNYKKYQVEIDANLKTCSCSCPYASSGENCKHEYAVLLAISNHDYDLEPNISNSDEINISGSQNTLVKNNNVYGFNFKRVSEDAIIKGAIEADIPVFLHGKSSDGKSARVKQIDPDCTIIYLRNATPEMLNGRSICIPGTEEIKDIKPTWLVKLEEKCKNEPDKIHVLFLDEISNALPSIQGMAFNIVLDKEVNGKWKLPENSRIVAAGNEVEDSLSANEIAEPLFNRFAHVYIKTTLEGWLDWALEAKIHPAIYTYMIYTRGKHLRTEYNGETPNADPRKWEMASKMLYRTNCPEMLRSLLGKNVTDDFIRFCHQNIISVDDILNKNYTDKDISSMNISQKYLAVVALTMIDDDEYENAKDFLIKLGKEFHTLFNNLWVRDNEERTLLISNCNKVALKR